MNYFLIVIILGLGGIGYYEYNQFLQKIAADQQQISTLTDKANSLQSDNKKLEDEETQLKKSADEATAQVTDLTKQVQEAQNALAASKVEASAAEAKLALAEAKAHPPAAPVPAVTNNLGTIATLDGKSYQSCQLLKVEADGVVINDTDGITKLVYGLLPPDLQKRFGYDPHGPPTLSDDQVQSLEAKRKAVQGAGN